MDRIVRHHNHFMEIINDKNNFLYQIIKKYSRKYLEQN